MGRRRARARTKQAVLGLGGRGKESLGTNRTGARSLSQPTRAMPAGKTFGRTRTLWAISTISGWESVGRNPL